MNSHLDHWKHNKPELVNSIPLQNTHRTFSNLSLMTVKNTWQGKYWRENRTNIQLPVYKYIYIMKLQASGVNLPKLLIFV